MSETPVTATALPLVSVIVSTDGSPMPTCVRLKDLATPRRASTESVAEAPAEVPAFAVETVPIVFA